MKKTWKSFKKSKFGSTVIEAMVVVPIWLLSLLFIGYVLIISSARETLASESEGIANVISTSKTESDALSEVSAYLTAHKLEDKLSITSLTYSGDWTKGNTVSVRVNINTVFKGINFTSIMIGGRDITLLPANFTNEFTIILNY